MSIKYIDTLNYVSSSAGSGKTTSAVDVIKQDHPFQNYLYIAPRINLINEIEKMILDKEVDNKKIVKFYTGNESGLGSIGDQTLNYINRLQNHSNHIIFMTTITFIEVLSRINNYENYKVIIDESVGSYWHKEFKVSPDRLDAMYLIKDLIDIDDYGLVTIKKDKYRLAIDILRGEDSSIDSDYKNIDLKEMIRIIKNPCILSYSKSEEDNKVTIFSYLTPEYFLKFKEVTFLCAHFDMTILYRLWNHIFKVKFEEHPIYHKYLQNISEVQGKNIMIGYLLDDTDSASKSTLQLNSTTGKKGEITDNQVIDLALDYIDNMFKGNYLIAVNKWVNTKVNKGIKNGKYKDARFITTGVSGTNEYRDFNNVAVLATTNPNPIVSKLLMNLLDIDRSEMLFYHQVHNDLQVAGRIIRDINNKEVKTIIVLSKTLASYLESIYKDSCLIGKVGDLPSFKNLRKSTKELAKYELVAKGIEKVLDDSIIDHLSFKSVKMNVSTLVGFIVTRDIWQDARKFLSSNNSEWTEELRSYRRK